MDFAALMSAELSKAKKPKPTSTTTTSTTTTTEKYTKQAEVEAQRVAAYEAEQARLATAREEKARAKRRREEELAEEDQAREEKRRRLADEARARRVEREKEEERARRRRLGLPELVERDIDEDEEGEQEGEGDGEKVDEEEVVRRLREMGQPATLFGETRAARLRRMWKRTKANAMANSATAPIPTTLAFVPEKEMKVPAAGDVPPASDRQGRVFLFRQLVSYFSMVLVEYERAMAAEERRDTIASRTAFSAMEQCRENMKPLFRKFEKGDLEDELLTPIVEIVRAAQERRYVDANDGYLRLSIGKAAWPIGVTMVGIHERSAREKLHGGARGHVMGDEVTRKFLQSIKRCLTFAQVRWPPEDMRQLMG